VPRIQAPTVAEHRAARLRILLDAARAEVTETGRPPTIGAVATRAGMARPTVYEYFGSGEDLLAALAEDIAPRWTSRLRGRMSEATTPAEQVLAYVRANLELVAEGEHATIAAIASAAPGHVTGERAAAMHAALLVPLGEALAELGADPVPVVAAAIDGMVRATARTIEEGTPLDVAWGTVRRMLEPFLAGPAA
jgi:AcrR family transcriptional regulator